MKVYHYNQETKELIRESDARINPRGTTYTEVEEGSTETPQPIYSYLLPANATFIEPHESKDDNTSVFDIDNQEWVHMLDKRGTEYWTSIDGVITKYIITEIGVDVADGALLEEPTDETPAISQLELDYLTWDTEVETILNANPVLAAEFVTYVPSLIILRANRQPGLYYEYLTTIPIEEGDTLAEAVIEQLKESTLKLLL